MPVTLTPLKVLIVDDSAIFRKILRNILIKEERFSVVGEARHGEEALKLIKRHQPDALILDVDMPIMDGLETLKAVRKDHPGVESIMFSAHTHAGAHVTFQALENGAFDFVAKPESSSINEGVNLVASQIIPKLTFLHTRKTLRDVSRGGKPSDTFSKPVPAPSDSKPEEVIKEHPRLRPEVVAVGVSTGGPRALAHLIPALPLSLPVGMLVVQHMPPLFTKALALRLNELTDLIVREAEQGEPIQSGHILIAPGGFHLEVYQDSSGPAVIHLSDGPPEHGCKPAADVLFRSVADVYGPQALGVIMTGMGSDGLDGLAHMKRKGAMVFAQDQASCTVYGMPRRVIEHNLADAVLPLGDLARAIDSAVSTGENKPI
jgi:two-component system chemotaxis response regulator CheB